jgi:flavin reductase (DIM6/NTAB) family NADH-FMN oxidoreductase RutF
MSDRTDDPRPDEHVPVPFQDWEWLLDNEPTDPHQLRRVFAQAPSSVVTLCALVEGDLPVGMTVGTFVPVSLDPPLVSVCIAESSTSWPRLRSAARIGVSVLASDHDLLARRLSSKDHDRLKDAPMLRSPTGALLVDGGVAWLECSVWSEHSAGDHSIVVLRIHRHGLDESAEPLVFHRSAFRALRPLSD